ncbi:hypothetical protein BGW36DRAFT_422529 [Talaromyces proteolyticus]|uniref:Uncharacterized protein n=1 Tax=Talaromyces proteolyticus TaxID=1131652 RepID=A0AAD4L6G6_9EURO|nr:uncharacterized protein BGW36DRAFT_422529 [Talaromyces proteolyticus]KAH8706006.1 hypothetical protein BGW36DRAFT_422529 [Talaromyces proteolyticus]
MASDSDYMDFLNKANQQRDAGIDKPQAESTAPSSQQVRTRTVETSAKVPDVLKKVDSFYISETDEPFEPVALEWEGASRGKWPTPDQFASLITTSKSAASDISQSIETLPPSSFDPRDQYSSVIGTVREAAAASDPNVDESEIDVKVYRVEVGHNRIEYWVVALSATNGNIVGFRAKAVES